MYVLLALLLYNSLSLSLYIYIYTHVYTYAHVSLSLSIYIYIYIVHTSVRCYFWHEFRSPGEHGAPWLRVLESSLLQPSRI